MRQDRETTATRTKIVLVQPNAPRKPVLGAACNGCGVCCLAAPCPLGVVLSRRWRGACAALRWDPEHAVYRCGAVLWASAPAQPGSSAGRRWLAAKLRPVSLRLILRWIAAGQGCDCSLQVCHPPQNFTHNSQTSAHCGAPGQHD